MIRTSVTLSTQNERFWSGVIPHGQKGRVINYLFDRLREELGDEPARPEHSIDPDKLEHFLGKLLAKKITLS